jgi:hypothetical protein
LRFHPNTGPRKRLRRLRHGHIFGAKLTLPFHGRMMTIPIGARMARVVIAAPKDISHWAAAHVGEERLAIACTLRVDSLGINEIFWLDNEDGNTLAKITAGKGDPKLGLRQLPVSREVADPSICAFYKVELIALAVDADDEAKYRIVKGAPRGQRRLSVAAKLERAA